MLSLGLSFLPKLAHQNVCSQQMNVLCRFLCQPLFLLAQHLLVTVTTIATRNLGTIRSVSCGMRNSRKPRSIRLIKSTFGARLFFFHCKKVTGCLYPVKMPILHIYLFSRKPKGSLRFISLERWEGTNLLGGNGYKSQCPINGHPRRLHHI